MNVYIIFRVEGWYSLGLRDDEQARVVAENNPGTVRIETWDNKLVWHSMSEGETVQ